MCKNLSSILISSQVFLMLWKGTKKMEEHTNGNKKCRFFSKYIAA